MVKIGSNRIKYGQFTIIIVGFLFSSIVYWAYYQEKNSNYFFILIISLVFFIIVLLNSKSIYNVKVDKNYFYFENVFRKIKEKRENFSFIKLESKLPYTISITFNDGKRYKFMLDSSDSFRARISFNKKITERQIVEEIEKIISNPSLS